MHTHPTRATPRPLHLAILSDLHIDIEDDEDSWDLAKRAFRAASRAGVDHVVIVGDLFDSATAMENDRDQVRRYLRRSGLWHRDRLTLVVGNHDFYRLGSLGNVLKGNGDAQENYEGFCEWAGDLVHKDDRLSGRDDLYPIQKHLGQVTLWAADTTSSHVTTSSNGYWPKVDDNLLRTAVPDSRERRVLAIHHPPYVDVEQTNARTVGEFFRSGFRPSQMEFAFGFPASEYRRLRKFTTDARVDAIVCGHVHDWGDAEDVDPWTWTVGRKHRSVIHCVGRTNAMGDTEPAFGILEVPPTGDLNWREVKF